MLFLIVCFFLCTARFLREEVKRFDGRERRFFPVFKFCIFFITRPLLSFFCILVWDRFVPFLLFLFLWMVIASFHESASRLAKERGDEPLGYVLKIACSFIFLFFVFSLFSALFMLSVKPLFTLILVIVFFLFYRYFSFIFALQLGNICLILLFIYLCSPLNSLKEKAALKASNVVRLRVASGPARNIFTDTNEENLYFTAHSAYKRYGAKYKTLFRVSLKNPNDVSTLKYFFIPSGVYDEKRNKLFAINQDTDELLALDPITLKILKKKKVRRDPDDIFIDHIRNRVIVSFEEGALSAYDPESLQEKHHVVWHRNVECCGISKGIYSKKLDTIFTANLSTPYILTGWRLDVLKITQAKFLGISSWGITLDGAQKNIYITDFLLGRLYQVDAENFSLKKTVWIKSGIRPIAVDDKRGLVFVGNYLEPHLFILNRDFKIIKKIFVGHPCRGLKLLKNGRLFAATSFGLVEVDMDKCCKKHD